MQLVWLSTAIVFFHTFMHTFHTLGICFIPKWPVFIPGARFSYLFVIIKTIWYAIVWRSVPGRKGMKNVPKVWNKSKKVWKCCTRYEKSSFGYETNAKGMKQMTNVLKQTHLWRMPDLHSLAFSLRLAPYCRSCPCDRHDLYLPSLPASLQTLGQLG